MTEQRKARDDAEWYHFDIHGVRAANFTPFNHDYTPQLEPINVPLPQDVPESISAFSPGTLQDKVVDPYFPIAELRKKFEGKGRRLGGYLILLRGLRLRDKRNYGKYSLDGRLPQWKDIAMDMHSVGMTHEFLPEVHPFAVLHLNYCLGYNERRLNYHKTIRMYDRDIKGAKTAEERQMEIDSLHKFRNHAQKGVNVGNAEDFYEMLDFFKRPAQLRQILMPPDTVRIPDEGLHLDWVDLERSIKRLIDSMMDNGFLCVSDVDVIACDSLGAYTVGIGQERYIPPIWANYGNISYWVNFHMAWSACLRDWLPDTKESPSELNHFIFDRYGLSMTEYFARPMYEGWREFFPPEELAWLDSIRTEYEARMKQAAE